MRWRCSILALAAAAVFMAAGCSDDDSADTNNNNVNSNSNQNPCQGVTCSGHGECQVVGGQAACDCDNGYHAEGLDCVVDGAYQPLPVPDACTSPIIQEATEIPLNTTYLAGTVKLAWSGSEAAVAYSDSAGLGFDIVLQRLSEDGTTVGSPVVAATVQDSSVTLASDRQRYFICWQDVDVTEITCATVPLGTGEASTGLTVTGTAASLAFGPGGMVLVYSTASAVMAQKLDDQALALGSAVQVAGSSEDYTAVAATAGGYRVAAGTTWNGGSLTLYQMDADLQAQGSPVTLVSGNGARPVQVAAYSGSTAAVFGDTDQVSAMTVDGSGNATAKVKVDAQDASNIYVWTGAAAGPSTFALVWSAYEGYIGYRVLDSAGQPQGEMVELIYTMWDDNPVSMVGVSDGYLVAVGMGVFQDATLAVHRVLCPE